jgi:hypothetical protein
MEGTATSGYCEDPPIAAEPTPSGEDHKGSIFDQSVE